MHGVAGAVYLLGPCRNSRKSAINVHIILRTDIYLVRGDVCVGETGQVLQTNATVERI